MINENLAKAIEVMRTGNYKYLKGAFKEADCFCAVGVLIDLFIKAHPVNYCWYDPDDEAYDPKSSELMEFYVDETGYSQIFWDTTALPTSVQLWYGFSEPHVKVRFNDPDSTRQYALYHISDMGYGIEVDPQHPFKLIADLLEYNYSQVDEK